MKRRLIVMRHAKSSWKTKASSDHARPLNERGRRDAPRVGARIGELGWTPARIVSSDSTRTIETVEGMALDVPVTFTADLYHAGTEEVRQHVGALPDATSPTMVVGHNPGWEDVVEWLTGESVVMKTACAVLLEHPAASWSEAMADPGSWQLVDMVAPRDL